MKKPLILSLILHICMLGTFITWGTISYPWPRRFEVYPVQLITVPTPKPPVKLEKKVTFPPKQEVPKPKPKAVHPSKVDKKVPIKPEIAKKSQKQPLKQSENNTKDNEEYLPANNQIKIETQKFPFAYYLNLIRYRVQENWDPPFQANTKKESISAVVGFKVLRDGRIADVVVENPSGIFLFDQAARRAVLTAGPLPPLPDEFTEEYLTVHMEFEVTW